MSRRPGPEQAVLRACLEWRRAEVREAAIRLGVIGGQTPDPENPERLLNDLRALVDELPDQRQREER